MNKTHVIILGGGISGLSARYYLTKHHPKVRVSLLEKEEQIGGVIKTEKGPFFFERGPRTFKTSRCPTLLSLIDELGLTKQLIFSSKDAKQRFLWKEGRLNKLPTRPMEILSSSMMRKALFPLFFEWSRNRAKIEDETIYSFAKRRFGKYVAETFFDPLALGIFAGDIKKLSIRTCLPTLKEWEKKYGSMTRAMLSKKRDHQGKGLFTLKEGLSELVAALLSGGHGEVYSDFEAKELCFNRGKVIVKGKDKKFIGTHLISALPAPVIYKLLKPHSSAFDTFFEPLKMVGVTAAHLGYNKNLIKHPGFGYLVPSTEKSVVLGTVFDSSIFPQQSHNQETRMTMMLGGSFHPSFPFSSKKEVMEKALSGIKEHLKIDEKPNYVSIVSYPEVLPQFAVGHEKRVKTLQTALSKTLPQVTLVGNYLSGVSVESCLVESKQLLLPSF